MNTTYDAIIVLGSQPDPQNWRFPEQIYSCLDKAAELLKTGVAPYIITSGDHTINFDFDGIVQPVTECEMMADYLLTHGVGKESLLGEKQSKDSISNLYYLKEDILVPYKMHRLLFVVASFRIPRLEFLCTKVLGPDYAIAFEPIDAEQGSTYNEASTMQRQQAFLANMTNGDHAWLADKFYTHPFYGRSYDTVHNQVLHLNTIDAQAMVLQPK